MDHQLRPPAPFWGSAVIKWVSVVPIALAMLFGVALVLAADAPTLEDRASAIERASTLPEGVRVVLGHLSRELALSAETLRAERAKTGLGWGELLIAHRLSRSTGVPVEQIATEFRGGKTWEAVARDHDVDLSALVQLVQHSQDVIEQRSDDKAPRAIESPPVRGQGGAGPGRGMGRAGSRSASQPGDERCLTS